MPTAPMYRYQQQSTSSRTQASGYQYLPGQSSQHGTVTQGVDFGLPDSAPSSTLRPVTPYSTNFHIAVPHPAVYGSQDPQSAATWPDMSARNVDMALPQSLHNSPQVSTDAGSHKDAMQPDPLSKKRRQDALSQGESPTPSKRPRRKADQARTARKPASPRRSKITKDLSTLISHMGDEEAVTLLKQRAGNVPESSPIFVQKFSSREQALYHLLRVGSAVSYLPPPTGVAIGVEDLESSTRATLQQMMLEAIATEPGADATPGYLRSGEERRSFAEKNRYQYDIVLKQMADLEDSSTCICLLIQCALDLHDRGEGIPINDVNLLGQPIEDTSAKVQLYSRLLIIFFQRVTLLIDIVKKYKWVAKDVVTNTNILEMVVSPRQYLSTKLNDVSTAKTRQDRWDKDQIRRGVKAPALKEDLGAEVAIGVKGSEPTEKSMSQLQEYTAPQSSVINEGAIDSFPDTSSTALLKFSSYDFRTEQNGEDLPVPVPTSGEGYWSFDDAGHPYYSFGQG
ncbi:hypothetical protein Slin15195_G106520 [Septoria linicola]|uniref:Uncharacterized protein n=1 Tax=Septoria linicola TaxID=215465 RepID=A0A9Q9EQA3_9PEZI|nr:hypothetical protein Slin14017_G069490 [Septoria linicola]USW57333.1 hypothetical protein Slin15195_G106520 [Septoria linicola]